ncbi:MAG: hypothetical protein QGF90_08925 [Gammaproteobacteria bacterium]|jgi:hypothetical protein|nr:hypothetical protein [Gammaproteobacteria bacterium]
MKYFYWGAGVVFGLLILVVGLQYIASERVEVVELLTVDEVDGPITTRLWVVDDAGFAYLRVGADGSGWFDRILANGEFRITRNGQSATYTAVQRPDKSMRINELMQAKYTWGDTFIAMLVGNREGSIPLELHAVNRE